MDSHKKRKFKESFKRYLNAEKETKNCKDVCIKMENQIDTVWNVRMK
jgi:hypothetical protein